MVKVNNELLDWHESHTADLYTWPIKLTSAVLRVHNGAGSYQNRTTLQYSKQTVAHWLKSGTRVAHAGHMLGTH